jgi:hypothetical protein
MGYAFYDTSHGPAGYSVDDVCHHEGCAEAIDRGLSYLCGESPVAPGIGCGWWFCAHHLYGWGRDGASNLCEPCMDAELAEKGLCCTWHEPGTCGKDPSRMCCWACPDVAVG